MKKCISIILVSVLFSWNVYASDVAIQPVLSDSGIEEKSNATSDQISNDTDTSLRDVSVTTKQSYIPQEKDVAENLDMQTKIVQKNIKLSQATYKIADLLDSGFIELSYEDKKLIEDLKKSYELNKKSADAHKIMQEVNTELIKVYQAGYQPSEKLLDLLAKFNKKIIETSMETADFMMKVLEFKPIYQG